jgi:hypothetical protein
MGLISLYDCKEYAIKHGFNSIEFYLFAPAGRFRCKWLDAYYGFFFFTEHDKGFVDYKTIEKMFPGIQCEVIGSDE